MRLRRRFSLALLFLVASNVVPLFAEEQGEPYGRVIVDSGLQPNQVLQRNSDGLANFDVKGRALSAEPSELSYRILRRSQVVTGFNWRVVPMSRGDWKLNVRGLPTGGPFTVEFRLLNSMGDELDLCRVENILVGDIWVTAGQSNMDGCGELSAAETPSEMVHAFTLADNWTVAEEPMHYCYESAYPVYLTSYVTRTKRAPIEYSPRGEWPEWRSFDNRHGTSLGLTFAKRIESETEIPVGLLIASLGGSTLDQWSPALKNLGGESLYGAMMQRIAKVGGRVRGILWYQGESDSSEGGSVDYEEKLLALVEAVRADLHDETLPFYCVQIGRQVVGSSDISPAEKNAVRESQRQAMNRIQYGGLTSAIDLPLSSGAHLNADGFNRAGKRVANLALIGAYGHQSLRPGPKLIGARIDGQDRKKVRVEFDGVNGKLVGQPRVLGFSICGSADREIPHIEARIDPKQPTAVVICCEQELPADACLWYGYGWDPVCTVVDEADMPIPAFGPVPIQE